MSRWRVVWPLDASIGLVPASLGERRVSATASGMGKRHDGLGGADRANPGSVGQPGGEIVDHRTQLGAVGGQRSGGLAQR